MEKRLVYLAVPYTHSDSRVMEERYEKVCKVAGLFMRRKYCIYSPISQCHAIAKFCKLPTNWDYWRSQNKVMLECCKTLFVLKLDGWEDSVGVKAEIKIAKELGIDIEYLNYEDLLWLL